jgi:Ca2+-binding EF-hand superfamily protein
MRSYFKRHDENRSGLVSKRHFKHVLERLGIEIPFSEHQALARYLMDGRSVNYPRFLELAGDCSEMRPNDVRGVHYRVAKQFQGIDYMFIFEGFDRQGDGTIHIKDLRRALRMCDVSISPHDWRALKPRLENNGRISYLALKEIIDSASKLDEGFGEQTGQRRFSSKALKDTEQQLFRSLARSLQAQPADIVHHAHDDADLLGAFEGFDMDGLGAIPVQTFLGVLHGMMARLDLSQVISKAALRAIAQQYVCPNPRAGLGGPGSTQRSAVGGLLVDYVAFCHAYASSVAHVQDESMLLHAFSVQLARATETFDLSFEQAMKRRDPHGFGFVSRFDFRRAVRHDLGIELGFPSRKRLPKTKSTDLLLSSSIIEVASLS